MTSQTGQQIITKHILPNILRSKGKQKIKFGQLIEHNIRNVFLNKSFAKYSGEASPRSCCKKLKLSISVDQYSEKL